MHLVVIHGWQEVTQELVQLLSSILGLTAFEIRPRLMGSGPTVVGRFADPAQASALSMRLQQAGVAAFVVDAAALRSGGGRCLVRRFEPGTAALSIEGAGNETLRIPYGDMRLLLPAVGISQQTETVTVTERKLSLGKTLLSGGIPMTSKVERREEVQTEERQKLLFLYADDFPLMVFRQHGMTYEGFGAAMKGSRELNFAHLVAELRRLAPAAIYDERLLQRAGQVRILGPSLEPDANLDLAAEMLRRCLLPGMR